MYDSFGLLIDGQWREASDGGALDVFGPATEALVGREGGSLGILDYLAPKYVRHRLLSGSPS